MNTNGCYQILRKPDGETLESVVITMKAGTRYQTYRTMTSAALNGWAVNREHLFEPGCHQSTYASPQDHALHDGGHMADVGDGPEYGSRSSTLVRGSQWPAFW